MRDWFTTVLIIGGRVLAGTMSIGIRKSALRLGGGIGWFVLSALRLSLYRCRRPLRFWEEFVFSCVVRFFTGVISGILRGIAKPTLPADDPVEYAEPEPVEFCEWRVFAGPALESNTDDPIEVLFDHDTHARLNAKDPAAWAVLVSLIEIDLQERH
jgi:hypothetical protein